MIIQWVLVCGLALCLFYAFLQRAKSRMVSYAIAVTSIAGIYFVLAPAQTNELAGWVGVGRGADLVLYCWILISLVVSINLQFKILSLQETITELTRELALREPREPREPRDDTDTSRGKSDSVSVPPPRISER